MHASNAHATAMHAYANANANAYATTMHAHANAHATTMHAHATTMYASNVFCSTPMSSYKSMCFVWWGVCHSLIYF
jgi:hypothetical protein